MKSSASRVFFPAVSIFLAVGLLAMASIIIHARRPAPPLAKNSRPAVIRSLSNVQAQSSRDAQPLAFEANQGQTDSRVRYMARSKGYTVFLTQDEAIFKVSSGPSSSAAGPLGRGRRTGSDAHDKTATIEMRLAGGNTNAAISAEKELPGKSNYFIGDNPAKWQTGVKQYSGVLYRDVYPAVNLAFHGQQRQLEFDFQVEPGAESAAIGLQFSGAGKLSTDAEGNLILASQAGNVVLHKPVAYQENNGRRELIASSFQLKGANEVGFSLGAYDHSRELVIDPSVTFATYLGGSAEDDAYGVGFDSFGNIYVTGQTQSSNFPVVGGVSGKQAGDFDVFVTKYSADGQTLIYSTYIGGSNADSGNAIAVDYLGNAYIAGGTGSSDFPHATGLKLSFGGQLDAFVLELTPDGSAITYSSFLGGGGSDVANGIAIDASGNAYVVGSTGSVGFPVSTNALQSSIVGSSNGFVSEVNASGGTLVYSTYLGAGTNDVAQAVAVDSSGNIYVTGATGYQTFYTTAGALQTTCGTGSNCNGGLSDAFVTVINPTKTGSAQLVYSTFLGGEGIDEGTGITLDHAGNVYVVGVTESTQFPASNTLGGTSDAFVTALNPTGTATLYSMYLGGSLVDAATGVAVDENQNVYVTGQTNSPDFPKTSDATQSTLAGGSDAFVTQLGPTGAIVFSTYMGGTGDENATTPGAPLAAEGAIAVEKAGADMYVAGNTSSTDFPTVKPQQSASGGGSYDAYVASYNVSTAPDFTISATTPTAVNPGTAGTSTVTLTAANGYANAVTMSCLVTGTGSPLPSCSASSAFSPSTLTPSSSGQTTTLTITTTGASAQLHSAAKFFYGLWIPVIGIALVGTRYGTDSSRRHKIFGYFLLTLAIGGLFFLPACSSSSSGGGGGGGGCSGCTPAGNYTVTISGTDNYGLVHSTQVTLTIN